MKNLTDYTEAELRAMPAGAEMDALVAAVLGCEPEWRAEGYVCPCSSEFWPHADKTEDQEQAVGCLAPYSTDPGEAFKALIASGVDWYLAKGHGADSKTTSGNGICLWPSKTGDWARDICVTMLLAKRHEQEAARKPKGRG